MDLKDGVAIVTGAVGTMGKGIFIESAQAGKHVAVADLSKELGSQNKKGGFYDQTCVLSSPAGRSIFRGI